MESRGPEVNQRTHWDGTHAKKADFFGAEPSEFGVRAATTFAQHGLRKILELGCGQGRDTFLFLQRGFEVTALDYAEAGLRQLQERAAALGVEKALALQLCDVRKGLPFPDQSFDGCFSHMFFTMELREKELQGMFSEVLRVLKAGGLSIYSVRNVHDPHFQKGNHIAEDMWQNPMGFVVHFFSPEKVKRLAEGYELLWVKEFEDPSPPFSQTLQSKKCIVLPVTFANVGLPDLTP